MAPDPLPANPTDLQQYRQEIEGKRQQLANRDVAPGGGGPHDPGMEKRVTALEADLKGMSTTLSRIETNLAVVVEGMRAVATKADLATLSGRVGEIDVRLKKTEETVGTALTTAIGKAIGPAQFITMIGTSIAIFVAGVAAYGWVTAQPWFHH